ncbi:hypothetical protein [Novosphingobium sediminicola]|uniref:Uncharacterized protein n=1 Tax=Novosphingobium sediminicola TaxID=563162 RepID=A0A7W6CM58_9SPHN|nr:hypothetical protein [Novosphingobium sediminicola]MBB3956963.1 hypothetical protein [Novosphingobium sediminicola]
MSIKPAAPQINELDHAFPEHLQTLYGDNPAFVGCPFHKALISRVPATQLEIGQEVKMLERVAGLLRL